MNRESRLLVISLICATLVISTHALPVQATTCVTPNSFELWQTYYSKNWLTGMYVWDTVGNVTSGSLLGAQMTWNETGQVGSPESNAIATGTLTLSNGRVIPFQFGTKTQPYVWWAISTSTVNGSTIVSFYIEGNLYVNGNYCTFYQANGVGTLADSVFTTI